MVQALSDVLKIAERAIFLQEGGASPDSQPLYRGELVYGGWNTPQGDVNPIYLPSRAQPNQWDIVDTFQGSEGLPTSDFTARVNLLLYRKWRELVKARCPFVTYIKQGQCDRPDDPFVWDFKKIIVDTRFTDFTDSADGTLQGDDQAPVELTGSLSGLKEYVEFAIKFGEVADTTILADVLDGFYAGVASCGGKCGGRKDECNNLYVLTRANSGSPGLSSQLVFSNDDKQTFDALDIPLLGGTSGNAITDAGSYLLMVSENFARHFYITYTNLHNLNTGGWTAVATDYVAGISLYDIFALSPEEIYIAAEAGYAYRLDNPTASPIILTDGSITPNDLRHVDAYQRTIVWAGNSGTVLISQNRGDGLILRPIRLTDGSVVTGNVTALGMVSDNIWFLAVGGSLYYTVDTGVTYQQKALDAQISVINSIRFSNSVIGYIAAERLGAGVVYRTDDAGYSWHNERPYVDGLPTAVRYNFVAPCGVNEVAAGGRVSVGGDGLLCVAE